MVPRKWGIQTLKYTEPSWKERYQWSSQEKATVEQRNHTELKLVIFKKRKIVNETHHFVCCRAIIGLYKSILEGMTFLRGGCQIIGTVW